ncbi:MAG: F0F1 ATP synthase subunit alpha, partial [Candidatus Eremiobacteraeota bacterium]|nr:F0F1 ATP synthase subunit alpha [Candidatus Eremiobacteraeota bacterium]
MNWPSLWRPPMGDNLLERQARWLSDYRPELRVWERGSLVSVGDGIAWVSGLPSAAIGELVRFAEGSQGLVFHLGLEKVGVILLHQSVRLRAGTPASLTGKALSIPSGVEMLGRLVDPLGRAVDGQPDPACSRHQPLEAASPSILQRDFVHEPLYTGIKIIDTLLPIGRGQRQLLIGDEGLGRSSIALDTVIHQKDQGVLCIYVLIGQKQSAAVDVFGRLKEFGALAHTVVVMAEASALPGLIYLAPFAGCAIAEGLMAEGHPTLVVYDDLSTHARAYRELSLLLRRPPGREAYPGDIFSLHARLLERATRLASGGSLTALPIVETQQGEISAYIPTNVISITDGQIFLDRDLFSAGFRPAIDISRSVSRIGGKAQHPEVKREAGRMKLEYLQFLELESFTRFGARVEPAMRARLQRGRLLRA